MKTWKHINKEQRNVIKSGLMHKRTVKEIGQYLGLDPTSVSKEVKRNRYILNPGELLTTECPKLNRWPYTCHNCRYRYSNCGHIKYVYSSKVANEKAIGNLISSRKGIDLSEEEYKQLDEIIKNGVSENKSIYQIQIENKDIINKSVTTLYRYINKGYLTTKRINLPYAVKYKKRTYKKKYDYSANKIDRTNHTYLDYLSYIYKNPRVNVWQLDFLGSIKTDSKSILSLILPELHFFLIDIINNPASEKIVNFFDEIEERIGTEKFIEIFQVILTDRDPSFSDIDGICFSKITGEERCKLFFCDPYVSNQKPHVENMNKQLRKFFPKGKSIDKYSKVDIKAINQTLINIPLRSLDSNTSKEAFIVVFGEEIIDKLI